MNFFRPKFVLFSSLSIFLSFMSLLFWFHYQCGMWHLFPIKIDYSKLEKLLDKQQWIEADKETASVYKQIVRKYLEEEGLYGLFKLDFLGQRQAVLYMGELPCSRLETLDRLWLKYSNDRFGFSVQSQMINAIASNSQLNKYSEFERSIQTWSYRDKPPVGFDNSIIDPDNARGYLPSSLWAYNAPLSNSLNIVSTLKEFHICIDPKIYQ